MYILTSDCYIYGRKRKRRRREFAVYRDVFRMEKTYTRVVLANSTLLKDESKKFTLQKVKVKKDEL